MREMKTFEVIIDLGSKTFMIEAQTKEDAEQEALRSFAELPLGDQVEEFWVGDSYEVKDDE